MRRTTHALVCASGNVLRKNDKSERTTTLGLLLGQKKRLPHETAEFSKPNIGNISSSKLVGPQMPRSVSSLGLLPVEEPKVQTSILGQQ